MSQQLQSQRLDFSSARNLPPEQAAFFHLGQPQLVAEGIAFFPALGNSTVFIGERGLLIVDTAQERFTPAILSGLRADYSQAPIEAIVYTHGHIDHVTGAEAIIAEAQGRKDRRPRIIAHSDLPARFDRYRLLARQNDHINRIQFNLPADAKPFSGAALTYPDITYHDGITTTVGGTVFELHHCRGETDDETWVWCPSRRALCTGDTFVWCSPNAGNPYKVQRYALDWARGLEQMAALRPLHLLPGHGPVLSGEERIQEALLSTAQFLRSIHDQVVDGMNEGKWLEDIIRDIDWPATDKPWLQPVYDHPQFIARNVYRLYGGWYDGDPANILPAHSEEISGALVAATGAAPILARARKLRGDGDLQLACHLTDFVRKGEPENREAWELWRDLFTARAAEETSLMARGAFHSAVREAEERLGQLP
ncbi:MAG TPA: alkyl sulfatase dimerization domain-containing protein [Dehalococcoidia bacterium]|nr:alkyl sulfatase dimerization domain-containing protein [Dehalococcoidia bacterium]